MNSGFSCDKKLVGKLVCVEADATIKGETCSDGTTCDPGFECASKEECSNVAVTSPVCAKKPVFTCLSTPGSATLCGNKVCSGNQKCEIISKKVCPVVLPVTGAVGGTVFVPGSGPVVVPGTNPVVIPGTNPSTAPVVVPGTIPGSAPIVIPGTNPVVIPGTTPGAGTPGVVTPQAAPLVVNGQVVPAISSVSSSLADDLGTVVGVDVVDNAGLYGYAGGSASTQDSFSVGYSLADNRNVFVASDSATTAASGESAVTQADGVSNVVARDQAFIVAEGTSDSQGVAGLTNSNTFAQSDFGIGSATAAALNTVDENFSAANSFADPTTAESITDTATLPGTVGEANAGADVRGNVTPP